MFKKWHITGRNNSLAKGIAAFLCLVLLIGSFPALPVSAEADTVSPGALIDLDPNAWYYAETAGAIRAGLFKGNEKSQLEPNGIVTRAQFTVMAYRLFGGEEDPAAELPAEITDVSASDWYAKEVAWAYAQEIVNGTTPTAFSPDLAISRQEMCVLMGRAIEKKTGETLSSEGAPAYTDEGEIASWALDYVKKCSNIRLFSGSNGAFMPLAVASRAQAACVLYRYYAETNTLLKVSGFTLNFQPDTEYYLCRANDFANCKILEYKGEGTISVGVEQYAGHFPYRNTSYKLGESLKLGHGRAKITIQIQNGNSVKEYLIAIEDPNASDYTYAQARISGTDSLVDMMSEPNDSSKVLAQFWNNARVYYLKTVENDWCMVEQLSTGKVGYIKRDNLRWGWLETEMPEQYAEAIAALQGAHPNWSFSFVDMEMTYAEALNKYGSSNAAYIDPANYLNEDKIFAFFDATETTEMTVEGIREIWSYWATMMGKDAKVLPTDEAAEYIADAAASLNMSPYYIACRFALESGAGSSNFSRGMSVVSRVTARETTTINGQQLQKGQTYYNLDLGGTYYNAYGIYAYDNNASWCMVKAAQRNWNSVHCAVVEGANWVKDQYIDHGSITPYFFRFGSFKRMYQEAHSYMTDVTAPSSEAKILKQAYTDPNASAHFIIPVYRGLS